MKKIYVLDTNVLLQDPQALSAFDDNEVVIPSVVLEEVDSKKRYTDELGRNARYVSRLLDGFRMRGKLHTGVSTERNGILRVELNHKSFVKMRDLFGEMTNDNRILAVALNLLQEENAKEHPRPVILVSKDALMRVKADALGLMTEDYLSDQVVTFDDFYRGYTSQDVHPSVIDQFYLDREIKLTDLANETQPLLYPHEFVLLKDAFGSSKSALTRYDGHAALKPLLFDNEMVWGITARNAQQKMALELLLDDAIPLVTITGQAGTGKTLLSLAAGLHKTEDQRQYKKLLVARPIVPVGKDIGYLPGEKEEKLRPWMQPIYDNLELLFDTKKSEELENILAGMGSIQVEALTYIRGRSIPGQFIIIDEAQNLTKHEVKTIVSRVGEGSKIIVMGDPEQIDNPYLDASNNGLTYLVEQFKDERLSGHIKLEKGERSRIAQLAAVLL